MTQKNSGGEPGGGGGGPDSSDPPSHLDPRMATSLILKTVHITKAVIIP